MQPTEVREQLPASAEVGDQEQLIRRLEREPEGDDEGVLEAAHDLAFRLRHREVAAVGSEERLVLQQATASSSSSKRLWRVQGGGGAASANACASSSSKAAESCSPSLSLRKCAS